MKAAAALVLIAASVAAAPSARPPLTPQDEKDRAEQGGCVYVSKQWLLERLREAREEAFKAGKIHSDVTCGKLT